MSCLPGSPCYNNDTNCTGDPCNPNSATSCDAVVYNGPNLPVTGIESCDNLCVALQKIDEAITNAASSANLTFTNGLTRTGDVVGLGGLLTTNTTINVNGKVLSVVGLSSQESLAETDFLLMETASGVVKKVQGTSVGKNITIRDNANGLVWNDPGVDTILDTLYQPAASIADTAQSQQIGDLLPDTALNWRNAQLTLRQAIDAILFPLRRPIYVIPELSWAQTGFPAVLTEVGTPLSFSFDITGKKWDANSFSQFDIYQSTDGGTVYSNIGTINSSSISVSTSSTGFGTQSYGALDPNSPNKTYTGTYTSPTGGSQFLALPPTGINTTRIVKYKATGSFTQGQKINMSDGTPDDRGYQGNPPVTNAPIGNGILTTSEIAMSSTYPFFYGYSKTKLTADQIVSRIEAWTSNTTDCNSTTGECTQKLTSGSGIGSSAGNVTIKIPTAEFVFIWIAHYDQFAAKTKFYSQASPSNIYDIGSNAAFTMNAPVAKNITRSLWGGSPVSYSVYTWKKDQPVCPTTNVSNSTFIFY